MRSREAWGSRLYGDAAWSMLNAKYGSINAAKLKNILFVLQAGDVSFNLANAKVFYQVSRGCQSVVSGPSASIRRGGV